MPKLLLFAPCDNVLISQENNVSLIILLTDLSLGGNIPTPLPENTATQMRWYLFTQWETRPEEVGIQFEQRIVLKTANGTPVPGIDIGGKFTPLEAKPIHRVIASLTFFPLVPAANYRFYISIRQVGQVEWNEVGDYPLAVVHQPEPPRGA